MVNPKAESRDPDMTEHGGLLDIPYRLYSLIKDAGVSVSIVASNLQPCNPNLDPNPKALTNILHMLFWDPPKQK